MKLNAVYALNKEGKKCILGYEMLAENEQEKDAMSWMRQFYFDGGVNLTFRYAGRNSEEKTDRTTALKFIVPHNARRLAIGLLNECEEGNGERLTFEHVKANVKGDLDNTNVSHYHAGNLAFAFANYIKNVCNAPEYTIGKMYGWRGLYFEVDKSYCDGSLEKYIKTGELADWHGITDHGISDDIAYFVNKYEEVHVLVNGKAYCLTLLKE